MSNIEWRYFKLNEKYSEMAEKWWQERIAANNRLHQFLKEVNTTVFKGNRGVWDFRIWAIKDNGQDRLGWRQGKKEEKDFLFPDTRGNQKKEQKEAGKKWAKRLGELSHPGPRELAKAVNATTWFIPAGIPGRMTSWMVDPHVNKLNGQWYLHIPKGVEWEKPDDLEEMKEWEYLKLQDEHPALTYPPVEETPSS